MAVASAGAIVLASAAGAIAVEAAAGSAAGSAGAVSAGTAASVAGAAASCFWHAASASVAVIARTRESWRFMLSSPLWVQGGKQERDAGWTRRRFAAIPRQAA